MPTVDAGAILNLGALIDVYAIEKPAPFAEAQASEK